MSHAAAEHREYPAFALNSVVGFAVTVRVGGKYVSAAELHSRLEVLSLAQLKLDRVSTLSARSAVVSYVIQIRRPIPLQSREP
jgi:hypothetical protein